MNKTKDEKLTYIERDEGRLKDELKRVQDENNKLVQENGHHVNIVKEMLSADMDG